MDCPPPAGPQADGLAHRAVMPNEVSSLLEPSSRHVFLDCTIGLAGHAELLLRQGPADAMLIGMDVDEGNLARAKDRLAPFAPRVRLFQANFAQADAVLEQAGLKSVDALLADLGIASSQLDDPRRGLSFMVDGPLDMRLDARIARTAGDLVNSLGETELADLIYQYGQERYSRRIAKVIVIARKASRIERTMELARIVESAMPAPVRRQRHGVHPATRTFQALRIAVNDEMGSLDRLLAMLPRLMGVGGHAAIISFHSLEDRRVKQAFAAWASSGAAALLTKKPLTASEDEVRQNPRSRSAKLRAIKRIS